MEKVAIRDFYGKILGWVETTPNGDKTLRDFYGKIKGYYRKNDNTTRDFYNRIIYRGDQLSALLIGDNK